MNHLHYAIVVGINRYPGIGDLTGARADAEAFAEWLVAPDGGELPAANVHRIEAAEESVERAAEARPTNEEIDRELLAITTEVRGELESDQDGWYQTRLYIYVAGHGFAPQGGEGALLLANAEEGAWSRNIELPEYAGWAARCAWFREVIVFADCCRDRIRDGAKGLTPTLDECLTPYRYEPVATVIGYGSARGRPTYEDPVEDDQKRGYFTRALIDGLRGAAPRDPDGAITAATLGDYVGRVVVKLTENKPYPQQADIRGPYSDKVILRSDQGGVKPTRAVTITFPPAFAGTARLLVNGYEIEDWNAADGPWLLDLADGIYEVATNEEIVFSGEGLFKVAGEDRDVEL